MATTEYQITTLKIENEGARKVSIPLAAGQVVYGGTIGYVGFDGYLYNATSSIRGKKAVLVEDTISNASGAAGAVSAVCYWTGRFLLPVTSAVQAQMGDAMYVIDNFTLDDLPLANSVYFGKLVKYISATSAEVILDDEGSTGQTIDLKVALVAAADGTAGAVLSLANPFGKTMLVSNIVLDVTTAPTDALAAVDAGVAANGTTASDTLIDGIVLAAAGVYSCHNSAGTNGGADRKITSGQFVTITSKTGAHLDLAAMVGTATITFKYL